MKEKLRITGRLPVLFLMVCCMQNWAFAQLAFQASPGKEDLNIQGRSTTPAKAALTPQEVKISGTVTSQESGEPLPGVNILIKGTTRGTVTDIDGNYVLSAPEDAILVFSFIGYTSEEVPVNSRSVIDVVLVEAIQSLQEVVVVGYGTTQKISNLTAAVDVVSGEVLQNRPAATVGDLLMGVSPNLTIENNGRAGEPGAANTWNIRGLGTISGSSSPLILIDGVEGDPNKLDPQSIESVTTLKDAAAASIYGSRAAFGVVLITTKKGEKGKLEVNYNANMDWSRPIHVSDMYPSNIWGVAFNQMQANSGLPPAYPAEQMQRIEDYIAGTYTPEYDTAQPPKSIFWGRLEGNANYNWPEIFFKHWSPTNKHTISLSGGQDKTQFYVSGGYLNRQGTYRWGNDSYKRYNFLSNITSQATDWLKLDFGVRYARTKTDYPLGVAGRRDRWRNIYMIYKFSPVTYWYLADGTTVANPVIIAYQKSGRDVIADNTFLLNLGVELEPVKGWKTRINYHYKYGASDHSQDQLPVWIPMPQGGLFNWGYRNPGAFNEQAYSNYFTFNATTSYERDINNHFFKVLLGAEEELYQDKYLFGQRNGLISVAVPSINAATGEVELGAGSGHWSTRAAFGRLNYDFDGKYLLQITGRVDGSSRFPEGNRWSFFPTASLGYVISKENFWQPVQHHLNFLKFRASYGSLGNQNVPNYLYLPTIPVQSQLDYWIIDGERPSYATAPRVISTNLTWETVTTLNLGLDARALDDRLGLNLSWFNRETSEMFGPTEDLPAVLGASAPQENNATLEAEGFELTIDWRDHVTDNLSYNVNVNFGDYKTHITKYRNPNNLIDDWYEGKQFGEIWGYETVGIIQTQQEAEAMAGQSEFYSTWGPGDIRYADLNGDGVINDGTRTLDDHGDLKIIGNSQPRYNIGFLGGLQWKNFGFNMLWTGVLKQDYSPGRQEAVFWGLVGGGFPGSESAVLKESPVLDYWRPANETNILGPNTDSYFPKPYADTGNRRKNQLTQTRYLLNAAYLRLRNVQLFYDIPEQLTEKIFVSNVRVYVSASNLLTITGLPGVYDPETMHHSAYSPGMVYPLSKSFSGGINVTF